jgi:hypothetical protein
MGIGEDTGETFLVFVGEDTTIVDKNLGTSATISQETETIHPIDPKYLPSGSGGGLPVVELETVIEIDASEPPELSESDIAKLNEVYNGGTKCFVVSFPVTGLPFTPSLVVTKASGDGIDCFAGVMATIIQKPASVIISYVDGMWTIGVNSHNV